ncbi:MAG: hypothetical protein A3D27_01810 [Omnitrophica WOR_2 bacterium RIFCSPHIGHO2_02_FULL_46_37]|nr:MAG: hypothetical protein A3D27_01810 [Omnitrophica WOR_2 bacterium RIFCSPHIGHO2_02_FULL_46_37]OGX42039.1 MAG: hypothetical protein A3H41_00825 [Omnitrophica WOR_2 bacterium RIFCSPLOWO2_02_FULL_45_28]
MAKVKLTKGELKKQRDLLKQYLRYLPTLQLKKQQLQMEILHQTALLEDRERQEQKKITAILNWAGLLSEPGIDLKPWLTPQKVITAAKNVAGVDVPIFEGAEFPASEYDLFMLPPWVDAGSEAGQALVSLQEELAVIKKSIAILKHELRITTQRVNLFEKVKIPQTQEAIRLIKIYIGDQMANAVGRSKIAKNKIERALLEEVTL